MATWLIVDLNLGDRPLPYDRLHRQGDDHDDGSPKTAFYGMTTSDRTNFCIMMTASDATTPPLSLVLCSKESEKRSVSNHDMQ